MIYTNYQLLWFFLIYAVIGWAGSTIAAAARKHRFIDVGFLYGPWCPVYGITGVVFAVFLSELQDSLFFLFLGGIILSFIIALFTGLILEKIFHRKWWNYSRKRFQFGGYVNLPYTVVWGIGAIASISLVNPLLIRLIRLLPQRYCEVILWVLYGILLIDFIGTLTGVLAVKSRIRKNFLIENVSEGLQNAADQMGEGLTGWVLKHLGKSNPELEAEKLLEARREQELLKAQQAANVFAVGCSFYKIVCLFFLGAFLGDIVETIFCYATTGILMSRSSVVYGPFSIVWGLGCAFLTVILYKYRNRSDSYIFLFGTVLGGAYEYICSVFTEWIFGTVFWDYSHLPFNLGGRINLLYCFFWGIAAVIWMRYLYPLLSGLIEKLPKRFGIVFTWGMLVFMLVNVTISSAALARYSARQEHPVPQNQFEQQLDQHFPDERMERIYPNAKIVD